MSESLAKQRSMIDFDEFERRLQRPPAPKRGDDPLAELARLVEGPADPYRGMFDVPATTQRGAPAVPQAWDGPSSYAPPSYIPPKNHPLAGDFAAIEAGLLRGALPEPDGWGHDPIDHHADELQAYDNAEWQPAAPERPRARRSLMITGAVIALGLAGIGASFALKGHVGGTHEVATINAVPGPTKVQPATQDGVDVPNQDATILDKSPRPNAVALSNHQEQPVDLSRLPKVLSVGNAPLTGAALSDQQAATAAVNPTPAQPSSIASLIEPRKIKTVSVRPDGTILSNDSATTARPSPAANVPAANAPAAKPAVTPKSTARVVTTPKPTVAATPPAADAGAPMQLSAVKPKPAAKTDARRRRPAGSRGRPGSRAGGGVDQWWFCGTARRARITRRCQGRDLQIKQQIRLRTRRPPPLYGQGDRGQPRRLPRSRSQPLARRRDGVVRKAEGRRRQLLRGEKLSGMPTATHVPPRRFDGLRQNAE